MHVYAEFSLHLHSCDQQVSPASRFEIRIIYESFYEAKLIQSFKKVHLKVSLHDGWIKYKA